MFRRCSEATIVLLLAAVLSGDCLPATAAAAAVAADAAAPAPSDDPVEARAQAYAHLMRALFSLRRGEARAAAGEIERAVEARPDSAPLRIEAADMLREMGRRDEALAMAEAALELAPDLPEAIRFLGDMAAERALSAVRPDAEARDEALRLYGRLIDMGKADDEVLWKVAGLRLQEGDRPGAIEAAKELVRMRPGDRGATGSLAKWLLEEDRDVEALELVLDFVAAHPQDEVFLRLADDLARRNDAWDLVVQRLGAEAESGIRSTGAQQLIGEALFREGHPNAASRALERALALDPSDRGLRFQLAHAYREVGRFADAAVLAQQLAAEEPGEREAHLLLAETLRDQGDTEGALNAYNTALRLLRADGEEGMASMRDAIRERMAGLYIADDRLDPARELATGIEDPDTPEAVELSVQLAIAARDWDEARRQAKRLESLGQEPYGDLLAGEILARDERWGKAREQFELAIKGLGDGVRRRIADIYLELDRPADAERVVREWAEASPDDADVQFHLGYVLFECDKRGEAESALRKALRLDPGHAPALNFLGYSLAERGERLDEALDMIQRALDVDTWNGAYLDSLGWVYYRMGRYEEARGPLERAAREYPHDPTVLEHLGDLYGRIGEGMLAVAAWNRAIAAGAEDVETLQGKIRNEGLPVVPTPEAADRGRDDGAAPMRP